MEYLMNYIEFQLERAAIAIGVSGDTPYLGEAITQFEHGQQAAFFAEKQGHSNDVMLAALLQPRNKVIVMMLC